jgi:hypothetical protein
MRLKFGAKPERGTQWDKPELLEIRGIDKIDQSTIILIRTGSALRSVARYAGL